jgi:hypothetical protein
MLSEQFIRMYEKHRPVAEKVVAKGRPMRPYAARRRALETRRRGFLWSGSK